MDQSRRLRALARTVFGALVIISLLVSAGPPATAQHEGHNMPKPPAKPKAKKTVRKGTQKRPAARRSAPRRKAQPAARRRVARPASDVQPQPADPHAGHGQPAVPTPTMPAPVAPVDPHAGHVMQPVATPTPQHEGHGMPQPSVAPTPVRQQPAAPTMDHSTMDHSAHGMTQAQPESAASRRARRGLIPDGPVVTLDQLEKMAAERNPTLAQAEALIRAAEGRRRQAGAFPNPVVGYFGEELAFRAAGDRGEHGVFVEQTIPLGGKLGKSKRVFASERDQAEAVAAAQRQRVLNSVRLLYFEALGAQQLVELRGDLAELAREAVEITKELFNVGQADRPDQLEIEIEAERAEIDLLRAQTDREGAWRLLAAMVGNPELKSGRLAGSLEDPLAAFDEQQVMTTLMRDSPEVKAARAGVERARALVSREKAERVPDLFVRGGVGYNNERLESDNRKIGAEGQIEVGVSVPVFNRNKGGIAAAEAELAVSERELERLQLLLRSRFASGFREYRNSQQMVERYRTQVVPRARQAYEMYLGNFRQMAASYPQVLIAQRTLFQVEAEYARALVNLRQSAVGLRGFLLGGGLDAVGRGGEAGERTEGFKLRGANDASGDSDDR